MNIQAPAIINDSWSWLWRLGYRTLLPITPPGAKLSAYTNLTEKGLGKAPGILYDDGWGSLPKWQTIYPAETDIDSWRTMGAGVGIRCEKGLLAIDADTLLQDLSDIIRTQVEQRIGLLPLRVGQAPKLLFFCRTEANYRHPNVLFDGGEIEVRTSGQFVASGVHPKTLQNYRWLRSPPPADELPEVSPVNLDQLWQELRDLLPNGRFTSQLGNTTETPSQESLRGTLADVKRAVAAIPNDYSSRKVYLRMGYAIRGALPNQFEEGRQIFQEWCARWDDPRGNDPAVVDRDFKTFEGKREVGIGWLKDEANLRSGGRFLAEEFNERVRPVGIDPTPYSFPDPTLIPVRASLYGGHYVRKFLSATIAQSKVGKSTLALAEALVMASGKPLLGVQPAGKFRVWWWNGEDPHEELERRVAAAMKFYELTRDDIEDRLLVNSGREMPIVLAAQGPKGSAIVDQKTVDAMCEAILKNRIDVTIADPFISLHRISENDNMAVDLVAKTQAQIAERTNSAFEAVHHSRKLNGMGAVVEDGRGASSLLGATRSMRALSKMSAAEAAQLGIGPEYRSLFRFSDISSNMAPPATDENEKWMQITSVSLGNGGEGVGDQVGVVRIYPLKETRTATIEATVTIDREEKALAAIAANEWRKDSRAANWVGIPAAQALEFDLDTAEGRTRVKNTLKLWLNQGKLSEENRPDRNRIPRVYIIVRQKQSGDDLFA